MVLVFGVVYQRHQEIIWQSKQCRQIAINTKGKAGVHAISEVDVLNRSLDHLPSVHVFKLF